MFSNSSLFSTPQPNRAPSTGFGASTNPLQAQPTLPNLFGASTTTNNTTQQGGGLFGTTNTQQNAGGNQGGGLFGATNNATNNQGLFGNNANPQQQQQQQTGSLFGPAGLVPNNPGAPLFGSTNTNTNTNTGGGGLFGSTNTQQPQNQTGSLFGAQNTTTAGNSLFGNNNANTNTGTTNTGNGLFSLNTNTNTTTNTGNGLFNLNTNTNNQQGGLFGNTQQSQQQQQGGLFGAAPKPAGTGLFGGSTNTGSLFGGGSALGQPNQQQQQQQQPQQSSLFGSTLGGTNNSLFGGGNKGFLSTTNTNTAASTNQQQGGFGASRVGAGSGAPVNTGGSSGQANPHQLQDAQTQFVKLTQSIEAIYSGWNPASKDCRFQHAFYNLVDPKQVNLYGRPPNATNDTVWEKALRENPDPTCLVPVIATSFDDLRARVDAQTQQATAHHQKLTDLSARLSNLRTLHSVTNASRLLRAATAQTQLTQRLMGVIRHLHFLIPAVRSSSLRAEEEALRGTLEEIEEEMKKGRVRGKLNELWAVIGAVGAGGRGGGGGAPGEWAVVDEEGLAQIAQILAEQQAGLQHLTKILHKAQKDLGAIMGNSGKGGDEAIQPEGENLWGSTHTLRTSMLG